MTWLSPQVKVEEGSVILVPDTSVRQASPAKSICSGSHASEEAADDVLRHELVSHRSFPSSDEQGEVSQCTVICISSPRTRILATPKSSLGSSWRSSGHGGYAMEVSAKNPLEEVNRFNLGG